MSRGGVSRHTDITPELIEKVEEKNLYEAFSVRRGTINIELEADLKFEWEAVISRFRWKTSGCDCGAKLHECVFGCKNSEGKWEDCRAFLYDPDNPRDSYLGDPRRFEVFAEKEFPQLRNRGNRQFEIRLKLEGRKGSTENEIN